MSDRKDTVIAGRPLRSNDVRQRNERLVLNLIYAHSGIAQSEIVAITGLKPPTVFRIFSELESNGVILECNDEKAQSDKKGRRPSYYCVNPTAYYALGVDFYSASASVVVVDFDGNIVHQDNVEFPENVNADSALRRLRNLIRKAIDRSAIDTGKILGIGVGAPGIVDIRKGRVLRYPRISGMMDFPVGERLHDTFQVPVYLHNTGSVIALSEYRYRNLKQHGSVFSFLIRSGVGGAFIQDGNAFVNRDMTALEVGHLSVDPNGRRCECGSAGCLETYLSEESFLSALDSETGCNSWEELEERLEAHDARVEKVMRYLAGLLAHAATNVANLLNPNAFLIVTRYERCAEFLAKELNEAFRRPGHLLSMTSVTAVGRRYESILACKGAADLVFSHFFQEDIDLPIPVDLQSV